MLKLKIITLKKETFNEREFLEAIKNINIDDVLCLGYKDPNISIENLYNNINYIMDEFAPFKKLNSNDIKLKSKPWINKEVQHLCGKEIKYLENFEMLLMTIQKLNCIMITKHSEMN